MLLPIDLYTHYLGTAAEAFWGGSCVVVEVTDFRLEH